MRMDVAYKHSLRTGDMDKAQQIASRLTTIGTHVRCISDILDHAVRGFAADDQEHQIIDESIEHLRDWEHTYSEAISRVFGGGQ